MNIGYSEEIISRANAVVSKEGGSGFGNFLQRSLHLTGIDYDANHHLGTGNLLIGGERHHHWLQVGIYGPAIAGAGIGYRYVVEGYHPYQDWLIGVYSYGSGRIRRDEEKKPVGGADESEEETISEIFYNKRFHWNVGIELATGYLQWTFSRYVSQPIGDQKIANYREEDVGYSGRLSTYYWQAMGEWGRVNPFLFGAYTKVTTVKNRKAVLFKTDEEVKPFQWVINGGVGLLWELSYIAIEVKAIGDDIKGMHFHVGCQLNFDGKREAKATYAKHRQRLMPEGYQVGYYLC